MSLLSRDEILVLANQLLCQWGLSNWQIRFDRARTRAGSCRHEEQVITLSAPLLTLFSYSQVKEVILHEIAHALAGKNHQHDVVWKNLARRVGANPHASLQGTPRLPGRWMGVCPQGHVFERHRAPRQKYSCAKCSRNFDPQFLISWTDRCAAVNNT